jgi:hypothetical protein
MDLWIHNFPNCTENFSELRILIDRIESWSDKGFLGNYSLPFFNLNNIYNGFMAFYSKDSFKEIMLCSFFK